MEKVNKIIFGILVIFVAIVLITILFLKLWPPLGAKSSKKDQEIYLKRATNYQNGQFFNENDFQMIYETSEKSVFLSNKGIMPVEQIPVVQPTIIKNPEIDQLNITWLGHSSTLMQMHSMNILIDPVFSNYSSPVQFIGPKRYSDLPIEISELPKIDIVIISHDHYDHLDYRTIKNIDSKVEKYIVPIGVENHLEKWGVNPEKITNLVWWEETEINGLTIGCTPARHYSGRSLDDRFKTLWASWVFIDEYYKVFESGDTGFDNHFEKIFDKYGIFDLALLDSGQYNTRWKSTHMTPEEAVNAGKILQAKTIMPIHWGAFVLSDHPWDDSVERFSEEAENQNINYITPKIGETIRYEDNIKTEKWWKEIK